MAIAGGGGPVNLVLLGRTGINRGNGPPIVNSLVVGIIAGAIGVGYFIYGKRQTKFAPMLAGVLLCIYPYFIDSLLWLSVVGIILLAAPFLLDF